MSDVVNEITTNDGELIHVHANGVAYCLHCHVRMMLYDPYELVEHVCEQREDA